MWKLVHLFRVFGYLVLLIHSSNSYSQEKNIENDERVILSDRLALKVGRSVHFISDIKELIDELDSVDCLKYSLALKASDLELKSITNSKDINKILENKKLLIRIITYLQLKEHITSIRLASDKHSLCKNKFKSNLNVQEYLKVENFLRQRFMKEKSIDKRSLKSFMDNSIQKIEYEILL